MSEMLVVKSKIKEVLTNMNVSGDFADALNEVAMGQVKAAAKRAEANGRKTVQARDVLVGGEMDGPMLVVKSKVKDVVSGMNVGGDLAGGLNNMMLWTVKQAAARAEANGRKTVQPRDL